MKDFFNGSIILVLDCIAMAYSDRRNYIGFGPGLIMIHSGIQFFVGLIGILNPFLFPTLTRFHRKAVAAWNSFSIAQQVNKTLKITKIFTY